MTHYIITQTTDESTIMGLMQNVQATMAPTDFQPLGATIYDDNQELIAGVYGFLSPHWLYVDTLWVAENCRGQKWGQRLMVALEQSALQQNIKQAFLGTADFQARGFYEKLGYDVVATYQQFGDHSNFIMTKQLDLVTSPAEAFEIQIPIADEEVEAVQAKLHAFNTAHMGEFTPQPVFLVAHDADQNLVGGLQAVLLPYDMQIGAVWLAEDHPSNLLNDLLQEVETIAQQQDIHHLIYRSDNPSLVKQFEEHQFIATGAIAQFPNETPTVIFEKHLSS